MAFLEKSAPISLKWINLAPSNFTTSYPSIWTVYPGQIISRETNQFLKETPNRKWQDNVYIQCEYKSTKQKIKHLLREENKVKENKIS